MTTAADDRANEDAFEALLAGRPAPREAAGLAAFTGAVRGAAASPGRPSAALTDLLSTGLLTDQSSPSARTAATAGTARSRSRTRRRPVIVPALIAKFLSAGAVVQAAAGAGVVVVVTAGAGTAGVLPEDAQTAFSQLTGSDDVAEEPVEEVLPPAEEEAEPVEGDGSLDPTDPTLPDGETVEVELEEPVEVEEPAEVGTTAEQEWYVNGPGPGQTFGQWVSEGRHNGWATGARVREWAHLKKDRQAEAPEAPEDEVEAPEDEVEAPEDEVEDRDDDSGEHEAEDRSDDDRGQGQGQGQGRGQGRGGNGGGEDRD